MKLFQLEIQDGQLENLFFASAPEQNDQLTPNLVGSIWVTCRSKTAKIVAINEPRAAMAASLKIFCPLSPELKDQLTQNLIGNIRVTCRSKIAKIFPI